MATILPRAAVRRNLVAVPSIQEKGAAGEQAFNGWLQDQKLSYLYVGQKQDTFASLFPGAVKRPDFLVLLESIGLIAVDVKNYELSMGEYTLTYEAEVKHVLAFERLFRIPVWYAYLGSDSDGSCWYWISALKALEVGEVRARKKDNLQFLAIKLDQFCKITANDDLGRLYTQRLPKIEKIVEDVIGSV